MRLPVNANGEQAAIGYFMALNEVSSVIFDYVIHQIAKGRISEFHSTFAPTGPALAVYCENLEKQEISKITSIERILRAPEQQAAAPRISEEKFQLLFGQLKQTKGMG
ncbi:hypothetical protein [Bartonella australis]|nr:hypothetical protein [Bartonella australis]